MNPPPDKKKKIVLKLLHARYGTLVHRIITKRRRTLGSDSSDHGLDYCSFSHRVGPLMRGSRRTIRPLTFSFLNGKERPLCIRDGRMSEAYIFIIVIITVMTASHPGDDTY